MGVKTKQLSIPIYICYVISLFLTFDQYGAVGWVPTAFRFVAWNIVFAHAYFASNEEAILEVELVRLRAEKEAIKTKLTECVVAHSKCVASLDKHES